jgi:hypothetical protein
MRAQFDPRRPFNLITGVRYRVVEENKPAWPSSLIRHCRKCGKRLTPLHLRGDNDRPLMCFMCSREW